MKPRVWAPHAKESVELDVAGDRAALVAQGGGWWGADVDLPGGTRYRFVVDGGEPTPDPRSRSQPEGPHGPSCVDDGALEESGFAWTDQGFRAAPMSAAVIYELHVGTFSAAGTFEGAIAHLAHLVSLGITHVELMPVVESSGMRGWGYDGVDLFAPHRAYGGPLGLRKLVDACHARGLGVIVDVVYNHLGPSGNYLDRFGPYFTDEHHTPWGRAVNFDQKGSDEVRRFFIDNARMWLEEFHIDGLRLDAVHAFHDSSAVHFLEALGLEVRALEAKLGRPLVVIAESDLNDPRLVRPREAGGLGVDAQWSDDFHHAIHAVLTSETTGYYADYGSIAAVAHALERGWVYDGRYAASRDRVHGRPLGDVPGWRLVGYAQTHDQVGNRARGERLSHLVSIEHAVVAAALVFASPFTPMLFMGEEWAASSPFQYFTDHEDDALAQAVRDGRRREFAAFGWKPEDIPDPQAERTFLDSKLRWQELGKPAHARMLEWHKQLIALRRAHPDLADGRFDRIRATADDDKRTLAIHRGETAVAVNFGKVEQRVALPGRARKVLLASSTAALDGNAVRLPATSVAFLTLE